MSTINDGGPAFPHLEVTHLGEPYHDHLGMSLRDWFASHVDLSPYVAMPFFRQWISVHTTPAEVANWVAQIRYLEADAILALQEKGDAK